MSGAHWTPYEIEIILHHNSSKSPFPRWTAPAYESTVSHLVQREILIAVEAFELDLPHITTTERGKVFVQMLLNTPLPENKWLDPRDGKEVLQERPLTKADYIMPRRETTGWSE